LWQNYRITSLSQEICCSATEDEISEIYLKKQITLRTLSSVMTAQVDDGDLDLTSIVKFTCCICVPHSIPMMYD